MHQGQSGLHGRRGARGAALVCGLTIAITACVPAPAPGGTPSPTPTPASGLAHFAGSGIAFDYPASWSAAHFEVLSSFTSLVTYVGSTPFHDPCTRTANGVSCLAAYALEPGQVAVTVGTAAFPMFSILEIPAGSVPVTAGGLPGYVTDGQGFAETGATTSRSWTLAMPGSIDNYYTVKAEARDVDPAAAFTAVDALIASWTHEPPVVPLPSGAAAAPAASAALRSALAVMVRVDPAYACFPATGSRNVEIGALPGVGILAKRQVVTCSTSVEATPLQMWRAHLVARLAERDAQAAWGADITMYITADGQPGATTTATLDK